MAGSFEPKPDTEIIGRSGGMQVRASRHESAPEEAPASDASSPTSAAPQGRQRGLRRLVTESAVVVTMVLACFGILIFFLSVSFPEGHNLRDVLRSNQGPQDGAGTPQTAQSGEVAATPASPIATLSVLHAPVHSRTAGSIAWNTAPSGLGLRTGDGIQTGASGSAQVNFEHGALRIENNSLVILGGGMDVSDLLASTPRALTFVKGEIRAKLDKNATDPMTVMLPHGVAKLRSTVRSTPAEFRITTSSDRSSAVTVISGSLALEANGKTVNVGPSQFSRIPENGSPTEPLPIPGAPVVVTPTAGSRFAYLDLPPLVPFRWRSSAGAGTYHLRATVGPQFRTEVVNEATADSFLNWGRFRPGEYEWQVSRVENGVEGLPSSPRRLVVEEGGGPIALSVEPLPKRIQSSSIEVRGKARPGATVYVMGRTVTTSADGSFDTKINLPSGANVVLVEAVDAAGNSTYSSQVVYSEN